ncbi:hypothetical protein BHE74_00031426 [Ensete ventricosum]|nr:hypothetical protein BHE74_00031426 [Ensete ventricosum]
MKLQPDNEPRSSLGIGPGLDDAMGPHREFARRFAEGIRNLLGARHEITEKRSDDLSQECWRLPDWQKLGLSLSLWSLSIIIIES